MGSPPGPNPGARHQRHGGRQGSEQLSELGRGREVLVLDRHGHRDGALGRAPDDRSPPGRGPRCRSSGGDRDGPAEIVWQLGGFVHSDHPGTARGPGDLLESDRVRGVGRADDHHGVSFRRDGLQGRLAVGGGKAQIAAGWASTDRGSGGGPPPSIPGHSSWLSVVWANRATGARFRAARPGRRGL